MAKDALKNDILVIAPKDFCKTITVAPSVLRPTDGRSAGDHPIAEMECTPQSLEITKEEKDALGNVSLYCKGANGQKLCIRTYDKEGSLAKFSGLLTREGKIISAKPVNHAYGIFRQTTSIALELSPDKTDTTVAQDATLTSSEPQPDVMKSIIPAGLRKPAQITVMNARQPDLSQRIKATEPPKQPQTPQLLCLKPEIAAAVYNIS